MIRFICPACWYVSEQPDEMEGRQAECPHCHTFATVERTAPERKQSTRRKAVSTRTLVRWVVKSVLVFVAISLVGSGLYRVFRPLSEVEKYEREQQTRLNATLAKTVLAVEALAEETDRIDPGWRLEDLVAKRPDPPDDQDLWKVVALATKNLPKDWSAPVGLYTPEAVPPRTLPADRLAEIQAELTQRGSALAKARETAHLSQGRVDFAYSADYFSTPAIHLVRARQVSELLVMDVLSRSQKGDAAGAWESSRGILNLAGCMSEPPGVLLHVVRVSHHTSATRCLERILADGQLDRETLRDVQQRVQETTEEPLLQPGLRGERAGYYRWYLAVKDGTPGQTLGFTSPGGRAVFLEGFPAVFSGLNAFVALSKETPLHLQAEQAENIISRAPASPEYVSTVLEQTAKLFKAARRNQAALRCAVTAVALERYRQERGKWPEDLNSLVAEKLLQSIPHDPYQGGPLQYRKTQDGVVVFSRGEEGNYQGDLRDHAAFEADSAQLSLEFRLWDPTCRNPSFED